MSEPVEVRYSITVHLTVAGEKRVRRRRAALDGTREGCRGNEGGML